MCPTETHAQTRTHTHAAGVRTGTATLYTVRCTQTWRPLFLRYAPPLGFVTVSHYTITAAEANYGFTENTKIREGIYTKPLQGRIQ